VTEKWRAEKCLCLLVAPPVNIFDDTQTSCFYLCSLSQREQAATKQEKGLGDIKMLWQDDGGKMI
jgi:hypothetical protein